VTPQVIDNFLPEANYKTLREFIQAQPMKYGAKSNSQTDPHGHWSWKPVHDNQQNLANLVGDLPSPLRGIWDFVHVTKLNFPNGSPPAVIRCYANGYTYGTDGYFHVDSQRSDEQTIIIYICDKWEPDWAGETVWVAQAGTRNDALPWPNRAVILPSNISHCARAVSRKCTALRTTFMFKTRPRQSVSFEKLSTFLAANGALNLKHENGTLHDHLVRVFSILEEKKLPTEVCFAGGLHSVYGTNAFPHKLFDSNSSGWRSHLATVFGKSAEAIAFLFSIIDRPKTLEAPAIHKIDSYGLEMRYAKVMEPVQASVVRNLRLIECANLLDQGALGKWPNLSKFWEEICKGSSSP